MPFKFVDDGYPEADDYSSNYVWVEPRPVVRDGDRGMPRALRYLRALTWGKRPWGKRDRRVIDNPRRLAR
ncbi:MAG: hypothetical protein K8T26_00505 [Lentisphaerae bacterium]|nr:hypothetical protein [Lentisphaerota bacterium]